VPMTPQPHADPEGGSGGGGKAWGEEEREQGWGALQHDSVFEAEAGGRPFWEAASASSAFSGASPQHGASFTLGAGGGERKEAPPLGNREAPNQFLAGSLRDILARPADAREEAGGGGEGASRYHISTPRF